METSTMVGSMPVGLGLMVLGLLIGLSFAMFTIIAFWRICSKAGYPGPLALLILVPFGNIILPLFLAFAEWPVLKHQNRSTR